MMKIITVKIYNLIWSVTVVPSSSTLSQIHPDPQIGINEKNYGIFLHPYNLIWDLT